VRALPPDGSLGERRVGAAPVDPRLERLAAELRGRLRPACRNWGDAEFEAVVQRIARTKLRWIDRRD
jgi:hypothetical protein